MITPTYVDMIYLFAALLIAWLVHRRHYAVIVPVLIWLVYGPNGRSAAVVLAYTTALAMEMFDMIRDLFDGPKSTSAP